MNALTPGYFKAMHVPMLAGRDFQITDQPTQVGRRRRLRAARRHRQPPVRRALLQDGQRRRQARRLGRRAEDEAEHRDRRRRREPALRRSARRHPPPGVHPAHRQRRHRLLRPQLDRIDDALRPAPQRRACASTTSHAGLRHEDARAAAGRDAAQPIAWSRCSPAGFGLLAAPARVDRPLRRDGVRGRPPPQGAGHPAGARRDARRRDLDGDARGADAARHRARRRRPGGAAGC